MTPQYIVEVKNGIEIVRTQLVFAHTSDEAFKVFQKRYGSPPFAYMLNVRKASPSERFADLGVGDYIAL